MAVVFKSAPRVLPSRCEHRLATIEADLARTVQVVGATIFQEIT